MRRTDISLRRRGRPPAAVAAAAKRSGWIADVGVRVVRRPLRGVVVNAIQYRADDVLPTELADDLLDDGIRRRACSDDEDDGTCEAYEEAGISHQGNRWSVEKDPVELWNQVVEQAHHPIGSQGRHWIGGRHAGRQHPQTGRDLHAERLGRFGVERLTQAALVRDVEYVVD